MTSLTLHLMIAIVMMMLLFGAMAAGPNDATTSTSTSTSKPMTAMRGRGLLRGGTTFTTTTTTQAPTLRAPHQRRPPTTVAINAAAASSTTPRSHRRRPPTTTTTTGTTTTTTSTVSPRSWGGGSRGRSATRRQTRDTPLTDHFVVPLKVVAVDDGGGNDSNDDSTKSVRTWWQTEQRHRQQQQQTLKTPRMIQRLVAGHIQNAQGHSTYEVSAVSANSTTSVTLTPSTTPTTTTSSTTMGTTTTTTRRQLSSSYRLATTTTTPQTPRDHDDDEALLNEPDDFDNWDNGILRLSAGSGKESGKSKPKGGSNNDDSKKTLAEQVRDGKYGLIERELFRRVPKRPGVLSYARNAEVPLDTERNYGGLAEQDIWLAEDHLLVIKGGSLNEDDDTLTNGNNNNGDNAWPPIDDYDAPERQIKIPAHPQVPPPFPVQLDEHGPLQIIRDNKLTVVYPVANETIPVYITSSTEASVTASYAGNAAPPHSVARTGAISAAKPSNDETDGDGDTPSYVYPPPYAPWFYAPANESFLKRPPRPIALPGLGPWLANGLGGSLSNNSSDFDEDDPALYYPPAYSFVYKSNYSNPVPPGPLVPGIVLPPPPNQFSRLEGNSHRRPSGSSTTSSSSLSIPTASTTTTTSSSPSTTTTTSSTTTTTTSTTTPSPLPKRIASKLNAIGGYSRQPSQPPTLTKYVERVPVPVAVPIPIYPINYQPTGRPRTKPSPPPPSQTAPPASPAPTQAPQTFVFVPTTTERGRSQLNTLSKSNPIYYEYFEAKRQPAIKSNVIEDFLAGVNVGVPKSKTKGHRHHNDVVVNITPKPLSPNHPHQAEVYDPLGPLLRTNLIPQPPHYSGHFQQPDFDKKPFLPMVNYSADEKDSNAFKAIVYAPNPNSSPSPNPSPSPTPSRDEAYQRHRAMRLEGYIYSTPMPPQQQQQPLVDGGYLAAEQRDYTTSDHHLVAPKLVLQRNRQLRVGKHQHQQQFEPLPSQQPPPLPPVASNSYLAEPPPLYGDNHIDRPQRPAKYQLLRPHFVRSSSHLPYVDYGNVTSVKPPPPPPPPPQPPLSPQYWQRAVSLPAVPLPPVQYKRLRQSNKHQFAPYFYASAPPAEPLYRLVPVPVPVNIGQQKLWRQNGGGGSGKHQQHDSYFPPERGVPIGHSLASDILVNYGAHNNQQFNPQAELVPPVPPPLSYQAQTGQTGGPLWSQQHQQQSRSVHDQGQE